MATMKISIFKAKNRSRSQEGSKNMGMMKWKHFVMIYEFLQKKSEIFII
jgi:hypothetical protein